MERLGAGTGQDTILPFKKPPLLSRVVGGRERGAATVENWHLLKRNRCLTCGTVTSHLSIHPIEMGLCFTKGHRQDCCQQLPFIIAPNWKRPNPLLGRTGKCFLVDSTTGCCIAQERDALRPHASARGISETCASSIGRTPQRRHAMMSPFT